MLKETLDEIETRIAKAEALNTRGRGAPPIAYQVASEIQSLVGEYLGPAEHAEVSRYMIHLRTSRALEAWAQIKGKMQALRQAEARESASRQPPQPEVSEEGLYFGGQVFDAFMAVHRILTSAHTSIRVVDNYLSPEFLEVLASRPQGISLQILTKEGRTCPKHALQAFVSQYAPAEIRYSKDFHDRFIIIDDKSFFHFGPSLKDAGKTACMYSRIDETVVQQSLRSHWTASWSTATPV